MALDHELLLSKWDATQNRGMSWLNNNLVLRSAVLRCPWPAHATRHTVFRDLKPASRLPEIFGHQADPRVDHEVPRKFNLSHEFVGHGANQFGPVFLATPGVRWNDGESNGFHTTEWSHTIPMCSDIHSWSFAGHSHECITVAKMKKIDYPDSKKRIFTDVLYILYTLVICCIAIKSGHW